MLPKHIPWRFCTGDQAISNGPCLLHGLIYILSTSDAIIYLYDDVAANSERLLGYFRASTMSNQPVRFDPPMLCERGLYIDFYAGPIYAWVGFEPVSLE